MIDVQQALQLVLQRVPARQAARLALAETLGHVLAEEITSDIDSPPHDKALMDGYALRSADFNGANTVLSVIEEVTAGGNPTQAVSQGAATRIMTGAPIPAGADAVVMVEQTTPVDATATASAMDATGGAPSAVRITASQVRAGQNIMRRAASLAKGETVMHAGTLLRPIEVGLLAEVGRDNAAVTPRPRVAVLSTGNELVPVAEVPATGQIRNSNGPMLGALIQRAGGRPCDLGIGRDRRDELQTLVTQGLESDVLVLSGGVSAGVLDLVPSVLESLGVEQVFHKVDLKPGKPVWFGVLPNADGDKLVFGLPGNPVSSLVCFELFVRPAIARLSGRNADQLATRQARLANDHHHRGGRPTFFPARFAVAEGSSPPDGPANVEILAWQGSADLRTLSHANCLACFPKEERSYQAGDLIDVAVLP